MIHRIAFGLPLAGVLLLVGASASPEHGQEESEISCDGEPLSDYNLNLAIASVFVMLVVSFMGAAFPALLALKRHPYLILAIKFGEFAKPLISDPTILFALFLYFIHDLQISQVALPAAVSCWQLGLCTCSSPLKRTCPTLVYLKAGAVAILHGACSSP